jgi:hypothetical protein
LLIGGFETSYTIFRSHQQQNNFPSENDQSLVLNFSLFFLCVCVRVAFTHHLENSIEFYNRGLGLAVCNELHRFRGAECGVIGDGDGGFRYMSAILCRYINDDTYI